MSLPAYGLCMIVKDAEASIRPCLEAVRPHIGYWTISDTGSSDGTKAVIEEVLAGIPGELFDLPFRNFGHNRSAAFERARGHSQWILALDADMTVEIDEGFVPDPDWDAAMIEMRDSAVAWRLPLVLRGDLPWRSVGAVHEYSALPDRAYRSVPTDAIRVSFPPTSSSPSKRHWHAGLLEEELARQPFDARSTFYLAQTYRELGDPRARDLYVRRSLMDSGPEAWYAAYRAALLTEWPAQAAELLAAWERWPLRLEPLYYAVKGLNAHGCHRAAYWLTAGEVGEPPEALFVEPGVWSWGIRFERSIAAWHVGRRDEFRVLSDDLLADPQLPESIREAVTRNLALTPQERAA